MRRARITLRLIVGLILLSFVVNYGAIFTPNPLSF